MAASIPLDSFIHSILSHPCPFRVTFEGVPVFLCTFHVLQAWLRNIRCKLHNKAKAKEAFDALYSIMYLKAVGTSEHRAAAVQEGMCAFEEAFISGCPD
jgi:hypothetical protein